MSGTGGTPAAWLNQRSGTDSWVEGEEERNVAILLESNEENINR